MFISLSLIWLISEIKYVLFWLYLWQLKDYHLGRFIDHFRTHKGQKIFFNIVQALKLTLFILFSVADYWFNYLFSALFLLYAGESVLFIKSLANKSLKKPKLTLKTVFLSIISFSCVALILYTSAGLKEFKQPLWLLSFNIITPLIISAIVLVFQPFFVLLRNNTLRKAGLKMEKIKSLSGLKVIAITGSYGKTSTKEFLATILSQKFKVLKTNEHQNSEIGVANCILNDLKPSHQVFIAEVGAYNKGKVKEVCSVLKPKIGIVTGVNEQHLALFGSIENLLSAEGGGELADALSLYNQQSSEKGTLIVNGDNKHCLDLYKSKDKINKKIYSFKNNLISSDIWSDSIEIHKDFLSFVAIDKTGELAHFSVKVLGKQNVQNLLGAILAAKELGMNFGEIAEGCKNIIQEQAGMTLIKGKYGIDIVDSSYSANSDGVFADLEYFNVFTGKKVIVMPCLIELGKKSSEIHEKIGRQIGDNCDLAVITSKDKFKEIKKGAVFSGMDEKNVIFCDKATEISSIITLFCKSGDAVLLEGRVPSGLINLLIDSKK